MFDHPADPKHLIDSLIAFVDAWQGIRSWYGVAPEKLAACELPLPLAQFYAALGNMPGRDGAPFAFSYQNSLLAFEWLQNRNGRLLFALKDDEWSALTQPSGEDPPVRFFREEGMPELEHPSLANFLVTFCLQEIAASSAVRYWGEGLVQRFASRGFRVSPLWVHGLFPGVDGLQNYAFHLVERRAIICQDRLIGFSFPGAEAPFHDALHDLRRIEPIQPKKMADFLADPTLSPLGKRHCYERLAREHQAQADLHQSRAEECRRLAATL